MGKSGSSSIQGALVNNEKRLRELGIVHPLPHSSQHGMLAASYIDPADERFPRALRPREALRRSPDLRSYRIRVLEAIRRSERSVLSTEYFFSLEPAEISEFKANLRQARIDEVLIFGILRDPVTYFMSYAQQVLKGSSRLPQPDNFFMPYARRISAWQKHFSCEFEAFARLAAPGIGVESGFFASLSRFFAIDAARLAAPRETINESLSPEEMQLLQDFRCLLFPRSDDRINAATNLFIRVMVAQREHPTKLPILNPEIAAAVADRHAEEIKAVRDLTGLDISPPPARMRGSGQCARRAPRAVCDFVCNFDAASYRRLRARIWLRGPWWVAWNATGLLSEHLR